MGNPPFVGYSLQSKAQKDDILSIYVDEKGKPYKTAGKIDYVSAWYFKAAQLMSSRLDVNALMERNKSDLKAAEEIMPVVAVDNRNWTAVISLLKRSCEVQEELLKSQGELMTKQDSVNLVNQQIRIQRETLKNLEQHQEKTIQMLQSSTQELQSQAGKLNEEFSSQRKELEEWKHRTQLKMLRWVVISQSVLLILSLALQMWLR